jgi:hypothetical protein
LLLLLQLAWRTYCRCGPNPLHKDTSLPAQQSRHPLHNSSGPQHTAVTISHLPGSTSTRCDCHCRCHSMSSSQGVHHVTIIWSSRGGAGACRCHSVSSSPGVHHVTIMRWLMFTRPTFHIPGSCLLSHAAFSLSAATNCRCSLAVYVLQAYGGGG